MNYDVDKHLIIFNRSTGSACEIESMEIVIVRAKHSNYKMVGQFSIAHIYIPCYVAHEFHIIFLGRDREREREGE